MDERMMQFRVGVMILATAITTAILVLVFGRLPNFNPTYEVHVYLSDAPGVHDGTPVRKNGVLIGRVAGTPELIDGSGVKVTARINADRRLFPEEKCHIVYTTLGDAKGLEFAMEPGREPTQPVPSGHEFKGQTSREPVQMFTDLQPKTEDMMRAVNRAANRIDELADRLNRLIGTNEANVQNTMTRLPQTLDATTKAMNSADSLLGDRDMREKLRLALAEAPELIQEGRETFKRMRGTMDLADANLENLRGLTKPLGEYGPALVRRVDGTLQNLDTLVGMLADFSRKINDSDGTLGQLINNKGLYEHLDQTVSNANNAISQLQPILSEIRPMIRDLQPIIDDARVFTDKIARHPEVLGVRGALERNPGIK